MLAALQAGEAHPLFKMPSQAGGAHPLIQLPPQAGPHGDEGNAQPCLHHLLWRV